MQNIILTVQSTGSNKYRLGISRSDSLKHFKKRGNIVKIILNIKLIIEVKTTCGPPLPKGFDLYSTEIHEWILLNKFQNYKTGFPTKLLFEYSIVKQTINLKYLEKTKHNDE